MLLNNLTAGDFHPLLNQTFQVRLEGIDPIDLELISVTEKTNDSDAVHRSPFSLVFLGPVSNQYLLQHIYRMEHDQAGALDIFIVPLGLHAGRMQYEAVFN